MKFYLGVHIYSSTLIVHICGSYLHWNKIKLFSGTRGNCYLELYLQRAAQEELLSWASRLQQHKRKIVTLSFISAAAKNEIITLTFISAAAQNEIVTLSFISAAAQEEIVTLSFISAAAQGNWPPPLLTRKSIRPYFSAHVNLLICKASLWKSSSITPDKIKYYFHCFTSPNRNMSLHLCVCII